MDDLNLLAVKLGLLKQGEQNYNWGNLPWETLLKCFRWIDNPTEKKMYFVYEPPMGLKLISYHYKGRIFYDYQLKVQKGFVGKDLEVVGFVRQCEFGVFLGRPFYFEKLIAPINGLFINLVDMERFKFAPHRILLEAGERPFCIDYSFPSQHPILDSDALNKLREIKRVKELGKNAESTLKYLLGKYGISESDL